MNEENVFISDFSIGEIVYLKTDTEQKPRIVTGVFFFESGTSYTLASGEASSSHYKCEIAKEKTFL
jgi:hypothetical protein